MKATSGMTSISTNIGDPQSAQKCRYTGLPLAPWPLKILAWPCIFSTGRGTATTTAKALPVCRWQSLQWHIAVMIDSASAEYRMWPQRQPPDIFRMVFASPEIFLLIQPGQQKQQAAST